MRRVDPSGQIVTIAGNGKSEASGDNGQAAAAGIGRPAAIALSHSKLYIADRLNHFVREVDLATRVISTLAGTGTAGFSGEGSPARRAALNQPRGLALSGGKLFVADSLNHRVREIDLVTGFIRTVAGIGLAQSTGDNGPATSASINTPAGLGFDAQGRLLVTGLNGQRVRRIDLDANSIETVAGTGVTGLAGDAGSPLQAQLSGPARVVGRASGDTLLAERDGHRLRLIESRPNRIRTLAGTGQPGFAADGTEAQRALLSSPQGLATSSDGSIVFSDTGNHRVRRITLPTAPGSDDHPNSAAGLRTTDTIVVGGPAIAGNIETGGDADFFRFEAVPGSLYVLQTQAGTLGDTVLTLFDADGTRVLAENDDFGGARSSRIDAFRPAVAGTYFARVKAFQSRAVGTYSLLVSAEALSTEPLVVTTGLPDATVGVAYGFTLEAAGGTAPYGWTVDQGGAPPPGLILDASSGLLSGAPGAAGNFRFSVAAKDVNGRGASRPFLLVVRPAGIARFPESAHPYAGGLDETQSFRFGGSPPAIQVTFDPATFVEAGFDFIHISDAAGRPIPGSPFTGAALAGASRRIEGDTVHVRLVSDSNVSGFGYRVVNVAAAETVEETLDIGPSQVPGAQGGEFYSARLTALAALPPAQWSLGSATQLPRGFGLDTGSGVISGTTTQTGDFVFVAKVRDSRGAVGSRRYVLPVFAVGGAGFPESLHPYADSSEDSQSYTLAGNPAGILVTFDIRSALETGLDFLHVTDGTGSPVTGSPFTGRELAGRTLRLAGATVQLRLVSDGSVGLYGYRVTRVTAVPAAPPALAFLTPASLSTGRLGLSTSQTLSATGGVPPYRFVAIAGRIPPGLFLEPESGVLQGAPTASGAFTFTARVADSSNASANRDFTLTVAQGAPPALTVTTSLAADTYSAALLLDAPPEPLSRVVMLVSYDTGVLSSPRATAGEAVGPASVSLRQLASGLLRVEVSGPPLLTRGGALVHMEFDIQGAPDASQALVIVTATDFFTSLGQRLLLRPTADAGLDVSLRAQFLTTGVIAPTIPDPLADPASNGRPFVRLDGRESHDPNLPPLPIGYSWTQTGGTTVTLSGARTPIPTFAPPREGEYVFSLTVNNEHFSSPADEVRVVVVSRNSPPNAEISLPGAPADGAYVAGRDTVVLDGTLSTDADPLDGLGLRYRWNQTKGRKVELLDASDGRTPSTSAPRVQFTPAGPGIAGFELVVTDPHGVASPPVQVELLVRPENAQLPKLSLLATATTTTDQGDDLGDGTALKTVRSLRVFIPTRVSLKATVVDKDVGRPPLKQRLSFAWRQTGGPAVRLDDAVLTNTDQLASVANFEPTTSRVHAFECRVSKLDENGNDTGVEVAREIRVIVDSEDNAVPEALFDIIVEDQSGQPKRKTSFPRLAASGGVATVRPGARVTLDGSASVDRRPPVNPGSPPRQGSQEPSALLFRWTQLGGARVVLSNPFAPVTTFLVPHLPGDLRDRTLRFALFVDDGRDRSEPVEGSLDVRPPGKTAQTLAIRPGLNLLSLPLDPSTTGRPFTSADLLSLSRGSFVARLTDETPPRFEVHSARLGRAPFLIEGNRGYLLSASGSIASTPLLGSAWPPIARERYLPRGLSLLSLPAGVPPGYSAADLMDLTGASHVTRLGSDGRFEAYLPDASPPFPIEPGTGYLLSLPAARAVTLPAQ